MSKILIFAAAGWLMVAKASATITNALWAFPASASAPGQPIAADLRTYSTNANLGLTKANANLAGAFVANPGNTTALEFSYNGSHSDYLNGSTLTLTTTISGLTNGWALTGIQLSYDIKWNKTGGSTVTNIWAYSINGGAFLDFQTDTATGNLWQSFGYSFSGLLLQNGDTITLSDTFSGATGNNGNLSFDNIAITSVGAVPEPSSLALALLGLTLAKLSFTYRSRPVRAC